MYVYNGGGRFQFTYIGMRILLSLPGTSKAPASVHTIYIKYIDNLSIYIIFYINI